MVTVITAVVVIKKRQMSKTLSVGGVDRPPTNFQNGIGEFIIVLS